MVIIPDRSERVSIRLVEVLQNVAETQDTRFGAFVRCAYFGLTGATTYCALLSHASPGHGAIHPKDNESLLEGIEIPPH
jgi:hypothetical protein